uniref:Ig-like domain-containing protein n=1 Tax=Pelusios castaneus TaxID=367368 RepID=A0A8C8SAK5_9SAUR
SHSTKSRLCVYSRSFILFFFIEEAEGESVTQPEDRVTVFQGKVVLLNCTYDTTWTATTFFWYKHYPNKAPRLLLTQYEASSEEERRNRRGFSATLDNQEKTFHLQKNSSELSDSAVYYCAMRDTVTATSAGTPQKPSRWGCEAAHKMCCIQCLAS